MREEHWDRLVARPEGAEFRREGFETAAARAEDNARLGKVLADWCAARPKHEVARLMSAVGAPAGVFADPSDLLASEQLAHRGFFTSAGDGLGGAVTVPGAPYRLSRTPAMVRSSPALATADGFTARHTPPSRGTGVGGGRLLEGVRVLDFTWAAAGPYATLLLALLGANVVKVESATRLDPARRGFVTHYEGVNRSPIYNELSLDKRSLQLDLRQPEGLEIVRRLAGEVDVVVDNFRPGVMARWGLGAADLLAAHPGLVVASSSANGSTGPDAMGAGLASIFAATGGLSGQSGYPDGPPAEVSDTMDYRSGAALATGILAALLHRARTGEGQHVDLSSREVAAASAPDALLAHVIGVPWASRLANGHPSMTPHDVFPCRDDGWVAIAVGDDAEWTALCGVLGRDDWARDLRGPVARRAAAATVHESIAAWTSTRAAPDAAAALQDAGVPAAPVMTFAALADDPHLAAREVFVEIDHPELGRQRVMRAPWRFSSARCGPRRPGPLLGADNDAVLAELDEVPEMTAERRAEVFR
jgi:crotonobetainyl-CoA:carnitine CoA-transferase CaiB-like acyl-CoA transferase